ncbi:uncharacterized protein LOC123313718 [Coccinella septempunctata]|uniref:uncharacterized protein LOC123313718 n=1 Tax=Coccinella septempunctata TaxID=41139 RepID=UPI001D0963C8|nr:uncharacterized protein LOC123313718 [Coccinella septempunctata]
MEEETNPTDILNKREILNNILMITELGIDLQQRCSSGEKYISYLKASFDRANRTVHTLNELSRNALERAKKLAIFTLQGINQDDPIYSEYEKILEIIDKQSTEVDSPQNLEAPWNAEIRRIPDMKKTYDLPTTSSLRSVKSDVDEKYPENLSKESLIDLNNVVNLPPVPEDIFTSFSGKPIRSASLSSLKSIRKVKLFLQKAESSEEDDNSSENEDHDFSKLVYGDNEELVKSTGPHSPSKKLLLGNIKEEAQD